MTDPREEKLAKNLVGYSCSVKKGEKVLIEATDVPSSFLTALVKEVYAKGAYPFVQNNDGRVQRELQLGTSKEHCELWAKFDAHRMKDMDCYIGVRGADNNFETSDVPAEQQKTYRSVYAHPVHHDIRVGKTKWVVLRYPNPAFAQLNNMSSDAMEDYFFNVCNLDYSKMDKAMDGLKKLLDKTDKVHLKGPGKTDLHFSVKGIGAVKCSGERNIPDGEVYTAPVRTSVQGVIEYNVPSTQGGTKFENVVLTFKDGKIIDAKANDTEKINKVFDTDEGARYVGEFAIGVNPFITKACGDILFDEKITGSIHFTPGACYENDAANGNKSALHWDLVMIQTPEFGGGEIWFDGKLIRKDGRFVLKELECLNPENLK